MYMGIYRECKHCIDGMKNEIGETLAYCDLWGEWKNITLGDCFSNCESQEDEDYEEEDYDPQGEVWDAIHELSDIRARFNLFDDEEWKKYHACSLAIKALRKVIGED